MGGGVGEYFPIEIVSTQLERDLVMDDSWRQDGEVVVGPDMADEERERELGEMLQHRLQRERESEGAAVG